MTRQHIHHGAEILLDRGADWRDEALCRGEDPELFFPLGTAAPAKEQTKEAQAVCDRCSVREECLQFALDTQGINDGIYGGLTPSQRERLRRRKK